MILCLVFTGLSCYSDPTWLPSLSCTCHILRYWDTVVIGMYYRLYMVDEIFNYFLQISKCVLFDSFPGNVWWKFRNCETMKCDCHIFIVKGRLLCWAILPIDIVIVGNACFCSVSPHHKISTIADTNTDCFLILHMYIIYIQVLVLTDFGISSMGVSDDIGHFKACLRL